MQKKIITWLLIILVLVGGWWAYRQWTLLGFLLDEKGNGMHEGYYSYVRYFNEVEQLTAQLLLSNEPLEGFPTQNYFNYSLYEMRYRNIAGTFHRYGLVGEELKDYQVRNFVRLTDNYFNYLLGQEGQLTEEDRDYLTKIHLKTKELNDILAQYKPQLRALRGKDFFYSNIWVQAINEMNTKFKDYPDSEFTYSYPWYTSRQERVLQPGELEAIYGTELTSSQVRDSIQTLPDKGAVTSFVLPALQTPHFNWVSFFAVSLPLALLILSNDAAVGLGALEQKEYNPPTNKIIAFSGVFSMVASFLGGQSANIAGIMSTICSYEQAGPKEERYMGAVVSGIILIFFGIFSWRTVPFIQALPTTFVSILVGLALLGVFANNLHSGFSKPTMKISVAFTFLIALSNITAFNISAPVWALLSGTLINRYFEKAPIPVALISKK